MIKIINKKYTLIALEMVRSDIEMYGKAPIQYNLQRHIMEEIEQSNIF